ncbi:MAG: hypothetical protein HY822_14450 [Acidobacteria bacterium]|nr:hypothetical protein [Acidobacteriota bacterium]
MIALSLPAWVLPRRTAAAAWESRLKGLRSALDDLGRCMAEEAQPDLEVRVVTLRRLGVAEEEIAVQVGLPVADVLLLLKLAEGLPAAPSENPRPLELNNGPVVAI